MPSTPPLASRLRRDLDVPDREAGLLAPAAGGKYAKNLNE